MSEHTSEIQRVDDKLIMFMSSQEKTNDRMASAIEKISESVVKNHTQQVEINANSAAIQLINAKHDIFGERLGHLETGQAVATEFRNEINQMKKAVWGGVIAVIVGVIAVGFKAYAGT